MRVKILAVGAVAAMLAAAFFLPELLLDWDDSRSLDILRMEVQDEEREGFAESVQLSVAEKVLMLRSGAFVGMDLGRTRVERIAVEADESVSVLYYSESGEMVEVPPELQAVPEEEVDRYNQQTVQLWESRLEAAGAEIRTLQTLGGLPELWKTGSEPPDYTGRGDLLYMDPDTSLSFQVYQLTLYWDAYSIDLLIDVQSGRILSFLLQWTPNGQPYWGLREASGFGSAWRDYWRMDSVSTGWYNAYTRTILESVETQATLSGEYAAHDQVNFIYDSQSVPVPLDCQGARGRNFSIIWNR